MNSIAKNIKVFKKYFSAEMLIEDVHAHLKVYDDNYIDFEKDFYVTLINSNDEVSSEIIDLLLALNVNKDFWGRYFNQHLTVSQFLKELAKDHDESIQLNSLIDLIVKRRWHSQLVLLRNAVIGAIVVVPIITLALYPALSSIVQFLIETANILPILGILFSFSSLCFNIYLNHLYDRRQKSKIYRDDVFLVASSVINILGKIALVAKTMFAPYAAFFFIVATLIDTLKELFFLLELSKNYLNKPKFTENEPAIIRQQYARYEYDYLKQRNALTINFISALSLTALVITCSFFPVGLVLTLSTCASIASVYLLKLLCLTINESFIASKLQLELKTIVEHYKSEQLNEASNKESIEPFVTQLKKTLRVENEELYSFITTTITASHSVNSSVGESAPSSASRYSFIASGSLRERKPTETSPKTDSSQSIGFGFF